MLQRGAQCTMQGTRMRLPWRSGAF